MYLPINTSGVTIKYFLMFQELKFMTVYVGVKQEGEILTSL